MVNSLPTISPQTQLQSYHKLIWEEPAGFLADAEFGIGENLVCISNTMLYLLNVVRLITTGLAPSLTLTI
jgi:hypothetical protein